MLNRMLTILTAVALASSVCGSASASETRLFGYYTRSNYVQVDSYGRTSPPWGEIVLTEFGSSDVTRIEIHTWIRTRSIPSRHNVTGTEHGEAVTVSWTDGVRGGLPTNAFISFSDGSSRPIQVLNP